MEAQCPKICTGNVKTTKLGQGILLTPLADLHGLSTKMPNRSVGFFIFE
jgi:hypothetical protein